LFSGQNCVRRITRGTLDIKPVTVYVPRFE
jgi:hypothetical protein